MVHRMVAARVCGPHRDRGRHANKNEDLWESVHCVVHGSTKAIGKLSGVTSGDIMDWRKKFTRKAESGAIDKFCR